MAARREDRTCSRPYSLGKRQESSDRNRNRILEAACRLLDEESTAEFSIDSVGRQAGVTRQTVHNQFGTRAALIEAVFDQMALRGGIAEMANAMRQTDPVLMLRKFVGIFVQFWSSQRVALRRIRALATLDPELDKILRARNQRRQMAATRVVDLLSIQFGKPSSADRSSSINFLFAITSFEFFDTFAGKQVPEEVCEFITRVVVRAFEIPQ